jgi:alanine-alpha-ketoisovalerate/valine-pyruvate aminotransferase
MWFNDMCITTYKVIFHIKQLGIMMYKGHEWLILKREHKRLLLHHKKYNQKKDGERENREPTNLGGNVPS